MEKVMYCLAAGERPADELGEHLRGPVADRLVELGAHGVEVHVADAEVAPAAGLRIASSPTPAEAVVSVWVDSATDHLRAPVDEAVGAAGTAAAYLVTESCPLPGPTTSPPGARTEGMVQMAFLCRPEALPVGDWLELWLDRHTPIAIALQDTFLYVQNVVTRVLTPGATAWDAIVEEGFPAAAMTDPHVFFDAVGDDERLARHQTEMFDSVQRFIDLSRIDVLPTSRYVLREVAATRA
jgi:hypothetical protein